MKIKLLSVLALTVAIGGFMNTAFLAFAAIFNSGVVGFQIVTFASAFATASLIVILGD